MFLWVIPWVPWVILHHFIVVFGTSICPWNVDVRTSRGTPDPRPRILTPGELEEQKLLEDKSKDRWTEGRWLSKQIQLERLRSDCGVLSWPDQIISWVVLCPKNEDYHGFSSRMRDYQWLSSKTRDYHGFSSIWHSRLQTPIRSTDPNPGSAPEELRGATRGA